MGTTLNVTVAVLNFSRSADAADGANDHPTTFGNMSMLLGKQGRLFNISRNSLSVTETEILEILQVNPVVPGVVAASPDAIN